MPRIYKYDILYPDERYQIMGAVMAVYNEMGNGFIEPVYQDALELELKARGIPYSREQLINIQYKGQPIAHFYKADFVCYEKIIVELKAERTLAKGHYAQAINYLKATGLELALLANFGSVTLEHKWLICSRDRNNICIKEQE